jgi:RNA polymerase sigma-70 factor (ECF subfamily)
VSKSASAGAEILMASGEVALSAAADALAGTHPADSALLELCRSGHPEAFARLVAIHEGMVFGLAARLLGDTEEARDLAQEVFLQVHRKLGGFEGRSSLKTWIYRIVVNQCRNRRRWWQRRCRERGCALDELSAGDEVRLAEHAGPGPFEELARRERGRRVQAALLQLSFEHRVILLLREVEGLRCEEIAASLGVAGGTVKSRLARARDALRRRLEPLEQER